MGNSNQTSNQNFLKDWVQLEKQGVPGALTHIWARKDNRKIQMEEHYLHVTSQEEVDNERNTHELRHNHPLLVSSLYFKDQTEKQFCSSDYKGKIYLQRIPLTLQTVTDIPFPDALHVYSQSLQGFHVIASQIQKGCFPVSEQLFGINTQGVCKVWMNNKFDRNYPTRNQRITQDLMVRNILEIVEENVDTDSLKNIPTPKNYIYSKSKSPSEVRFNEAVNLLRTYANEYFGGQISNKLECVDKVGGAFNLSNTWRSRNQHIHSIQKHLQNPLMQSYSSKNVNITSNPSYAENNRMSKQEKSLNFIHNQINEISFNKEGFGFANNIVQQSNINPSVIPVVTRSIPFNTSQVISQITPHLPPQQQIIYQVNRNNSLISESNIFNNPNHQSHEKFIINNNNIANQFSAVAKPQLLRKYSEDQTIFQNNNNLPFNNNRNLIQQHVRTSNFISVPIQIQATAPQVIRQVQNSQAMHSSRVHFEPQQKKNLIKESSIQNKAAESNSNVNQINFGNSRLNLIQNIQPTNNLANSLPFTNMKVKGTVRPTPQTKIIRRSVQFAPFMTPVQPIQQQRFFIIQNNQQFASTNQSAPIVERPAFNVEANRNAKDKILDQAKHSISAQPQIQLISQQENISSNLVLLPSRVAHRALTNNLPKFTHNVPINMAVLNNFQQFQQQNSNFRYNEDSISSITGAQTIQLRSNEQISDKFSQIKDQGMIDMSTRNFYNNMMNNNNAVNDLNHIDTLNSIYTSNVNTNQPNFNKRTEQVNEVTSKNTYINEQITANINQRGSLGNADMNNKFISNLDLNNQEKLKTKNYNNNEYAFASKNQYASKTKNQDYQSKTNYNVKIDDGMSSTDFLNQLKNMNFSSNAFKKSTNNFDYGATISYEPLAGFSRQQKNITSNYQVNGYSYEYNTNSNSNNNNYQQQQDDLVVIGQKISLQTVNYRNANEENKYRASYEYEEEEDFGGNIRYQNQNSDKVGQNGGYYQENNYKSTFDRYAKYDYNGQEAQTNNEQLKYSQGQNYRANNLGENLQTYNSRVDEYEQNNKFELSKYTANTTYQQGGNFTSSSQKDQEYKVEFDPQILADLERLKRV